MKIIILGAGQVGASLAESLVSEETTSPSSIPTPAALRICRIASTCAR